MKTTYEQWVLQTAMLSLERSPWKTQLTYICCFTTEVDSEADAVSLYSTDILCSGHTALHICCNTAEVCRNAIPQQIIYVHTPFKQYVLVLATPDHQLHTERNALGLQLPTTCCPPAWPSGIACRWLLSRTH